MPHSFPQGRDSSPDKVSARTTPTEALFLSFLDFLSFRRDFCLLSLPEPLDPPDPLERLESLEFLEPRELLEDLELLEFELLDLDVLEDFELLDERELCLDPERERFPFE